MTGDQVDTFRSALDEAMSSFGIEAVTGDQRTQLVRHYAMLCRWNQRLNLTRIIEPREAARLHYAESLFGASLIRNAGTVLDIGSGAGFPAIPLAVARPDLRVTALEVNQKKSLFLKEVKDELGLTNLKVLTARVEEIDLSEYQLLTSRALDRAESIFPLVIERLKSRQRLMLYCGTDLVAKLAAKLSQKIETHRILQSETRVIAVFS